MIFLMMIIKNIFMVIFLIGVCIGIQISIPAADVLKYEVENKSTQLVPGYLLCGIRAGGSQMKNQL